MKDVKSLITLGSEPNAIRVLTSLISGVLKGSLLASPTDIRLNWKGLPKTNTLAYYENP
jgi:hypothetical protein